MLPDVVLFARTTKVYPVMLVGVPLSSPVVDSTVPAGKVPEYSEKPVGLALLTNEARLIVYCTPWDSFGSDVPVFQVGNVATTSENT